MSEMKINTNNCKGNFSMHGDSDTTEDPRGDDGEEK